jgi:uncharacterized SAM-binding protein YcdF (DUF218 family)
MFKRILLPLSAVCLLFAGGIATSYLTIPEKNTSLTHFDVIIVLGFPANPDGSPAPEQRERTLEGVREYRAGVAPRIIMTGGPAHNQYAEAHVMALLAEQEGVPYPAVFEEDHAQNTIQNAYYSVKMMQAHGWHSAEVISSPSHLRRASLIFKQFPIQWRMHAAHWPASYGNSYIWGIYTAEALYSARLRLFGFRRTPFLPTASVALLVPNQASGIPQ